MGTKIRLWRIDEDKLNEVGTEDKIRFEEDLHTRLEKDLSLISDNILLLKSRVRTEYGTEIDLLGIDANGDLVVIELKRGKTAEDVTAQALDYAAWVSTLDYERVIDIASEHYGGEDKFREAFKKEFDLDDIPEALNQSYNIIIVGTALDEKTERIVNFLSGEYGVPINAVLFECFRDREVAYLARTTVIDEEIAKTRPKTKRAPNFSDEEIDEIVERLGVKKLYDTAVEQALRVFHYKRNTVTTVSFEWRLKEDGKSYRRTVLLIYPKESSKEMGLNVLVYGPRLREYFKLDVDKWVERHSGKQVTSWYGEAYEFYLKTETEVERFFSSLGTVV